MAGFGIWGELGFFGRAVLRGILLLAIYDLVRIFRRVVPHGSIVIAVEDVIYWVGTALLVFQLLYRENDGVVRGYALLAVAVGMLLYHQTISRPLVTYLSKFLQTVLGFLLRPFKAVWRKMVQVRRQTARHYKKKLKKQLKEFIMILFS